MICPGSVGLVKSGLSPRTPSNARPAARPLKGSSRIYNYDLYKAAGPGLINIMTYIMPVIFSNDSEI